MISLYYRNKKLQCHDRWKKCFWSNNKNDLQTYDNVKKKFKTTVPQLDFY